MKLQFKRIAEVHDATVSRAWSVVCEKQRMSGVLVYDADLCGIFIEWSEPSKHASGTHFLETIDELSPDQAQLVRAFATERLKRGLELDDARLEV